MLSAKNLSTQEFEPTKNRFKHFYRTLPRSLVLFGKASFSTENLPPTLTSWVCTASSRVGSSTRAMGPSPGNSCGCAMMCTKAGSRKPKVLPLPGWFWQRSCEQNLGNITFEKLKNGHISWLETKATTSFFRIAENLKQTFNWNSTWMCLNTMTSSHSLFWDARLWALQRWHRSPPTHRAMLALGWGRARHLRPLCWRAPWPALPQRGEMKSCHFKPWANGMIQNTPA